VYHLVISRRFTVKGTMHLSKPFKSCRCASLRTEMEEGLLKTCWDVAEEEVGQIRNSKQTLIKKTRYLQMLNIAREIKLIHWFLQFCLCKSTCQQTHKCPCKGRDRICTAWFRYKAKSGLVTKGRCRPVMITRKNVF